MNIILSFPAAVLCAALSACSGGHVPRSAEPAVAVSAVRPARRVFHASVNAYGELGADSRHAVSLSLPQAGEIVAIDAPAGGRVERGDALLQLATDPATRSAYLRAQGALRIALQGLARSEDLHTQKLATNAQLDAARQAVADAQSNLAAQSQLGGGATMYTLKAPADGVVTALAVTRGQRVGAGTTLLQFTPNGAVAALLGVDPGAAARLRNGMPAALTPVYSAGGSGPIAATVAMVGSAINPASHLIDVVATLDDPTRLATGTALSATIDTSSFTAWSVPRNALQTDARGDFIYQIEDGKAKRVDVKVVAPDGSPIGVAGPLDAKAPVITLGSYEISPGAAVQVEKAPAVAASAR